MAKFVTDPVVLANISQLQALTEGISVNYGTAILNLQDEQVNQQAELDYHETRIVTLEAP